MTFNDFLSSDFTERIRIPENRDIINGIRCNRNERVEYWDKDFCKLLLENISFRDLTLYPDLSRIYKVIASYESIKDSNLLIGSGIDGIIKNIFETYSKKNMNIGLLSPSYAMYYIYTKLFDCNLLEIGYDFQKFKLNKELLYKSLSKIDLLFIPNPNQPIEDNLSINELEELAKACKKNEVLLIFDEAYYGFGCETAKNLIYSFENVGVMRTFSKFFGLPSARVGYLMANENLIKRISQKRISYETNSISQKIIINLLNNLDYVISYNKKVCESRERLKQKFYKHNLRFNAKASNFMLFDLLTQKIKKGIISDFQENKIYTKHEFKNEMENCILMTLGPYDIMSKIEKIVSQRIEFKKK